MRVVKITVTDKNDVVLDTTEIQIHDLTRRYIVVSSENKPPAGEFYLDIGLPTEEQLS